MNDKEKLDKVREEIAEKLWHSFGGSYENRLFEARNILSHPDICIKSDEQNLPELHPEIFAEGLWFPDNVSMKEYNKVLEWLVNDEGWIKPIRR